MADFKRAMETNFFGALRCQTGCFRFENQPHLDDIVHRDFSKLQQRLERTTDHAMIWVGHKDSAIDPFLDANYAGLLQSAQGLAH